MTQKEREELKALEEKEQKETVQGSSAPSTESEIVDPASVDNVEVQAEETWFPKRRGRKKGTPKANKDTAADLNGLLWMIHQGLASLTGVEEFALDPEESKELATSIARVQAFYPNSILSPMAMAWTGLFVTAGKVYGTRVIAYTAKKKKKPELVTIPTPPGTVIAEPEAM